MGRSTKLIFGAGVYEKGQGAGANGKHTPEYKSWFHMLERCYSQDFKSRSPTYANCFASNNFKRFEFYKYWCREQKGFDTEDWVLDKDLLIKGNKEYSENTCVFLPRVINSALTTRKSARGNYLIGVSKHGIKFRAKCCKDGAQRHIGLFESEESAFNAYKNFKEKTLKEYAERFKSELDTRAFEALMKYTIEKGD